MPALEIITGVLVIAAAVALAMGLGDAVMPLPPFGAGPALALMAAGGALMAHGLISRHLRGEPDHAHAVRSTGRSGWTLAIIFAVLAGVPAVAAPLNLIQVGGFPLGYYGAAQGGLILLAIIAVRAAARLDAIDRAAPESGE